jgi:hypothetical protein
MLQKFWFDENESFNMKDEFDRAEVKRRSDPFYCQFEYIKCEYARNIEGREFSCEKMLDGTYVEKPDAVLGHGKCRAHKVKK